jgi:hypothetical protein
MRAKLFAAAVAALAISSLAFVAPASAEGYIYVGGINTWVSRDCARVGTAVTGVNASHRNVPLTYSVTEEDVAGADMSADQCSRVILAFMIDDANEEYGINSNYSHLLQNELFSGRPNLTMPYQVFLKNIYLSVATLKALSDDGRDSCMMETPLFVVHCVDDSAGTIYARDANGNVITVNGQPWAIPVSGNLSQSGGTMWGNVFLENPSSSMGMDLRVQHHEQVHGQQWAQFGWDFVNRYASEDAMNVSDANYFYWRWGRVEKLRVPPICFNSFERAAGFADGNYAHRWDLPEVVNPFFPESEGAYPDEWLNDSFNTSKMCPTTWT